MIIKPSVALRNNYTEISELCHSSQEPIFITKNGEGDLVVMAIEKYERMQAEARLIPEIIEGEVDLRNGKYYTYDEIKKMAYEKYHDMKGVAEDSEEYKV